MTNKILATSMVALLTACSSGGTNNGEIIAKEPGDTAQAAMIDGKTLTAKPSLRSAVLLDRETGAATRIDPMSFAIKLPDGEDGDVTLILDGEEITFSESDRQFADDGVTYFGWSQQQDEGQPRYSLWSWNGPANEAISLDGEDFAQIWEAQIEDADGSEYQAYQVVGTETAGDVLRDLGAATYSGYGALKAYPDGSYDGFDTVDRLEGDVSMTADFGDGTISGVMDNLRFGWTGDSADRDPVDGSIAMTEASIGSDGRYAGSLEADAALLSATDDGVFEGSYAGDFFGPEAEATAGSMSANFATGGADYVGSGFFNAGKDPQE